MGDVMEQEQAVATDHQRSLGLLNFPTAILEEQTSSQLAQDRTGQVIHRTIIRDAVVSHYRLESLVTWYMMIDKP